MVAVATDDFNRANGAVGANWIATSTYAIPQIVSNVVAEAGATDYGGTYTAATSSQDDMYARITTTVVTAHFSNSCNVWARMLSTGVETGYLAESPSYGSPTARPWSLSRVTAGTFTLLAATGGTSTLPVGTRVVEVRAIGTTISIWQDGAKLASVTDSTHSGSSNRSSGIHIYSDIASPCTTDNFEFGTFGPYGRRVVQSMAIPRAASR